MDKKNRIGQRFGRLKIIKEVESHFYPSGKYVRFFLCKCDCGKEHTTNVNALRSGDTRSCGCLAKEGNNMRHGMTGTRFYITWVGMKRRSGRGKYWKHISLCSEWEDFVNFKKDMYTTYLRHFKKYGPKNTTIDRIDNAKGYSKGNCRWATRLVQSRNRNLNYAKT